jgi:hypothetical protein
MQEGSRSSPAVDIAVGNPSVFRQVAALTQTHNSAKGVSTIPL